MQIRLKTGQKQDREARLLEHGARKSERIVKGSDNVPIEVAIMFQ